MTDGDPMPDRYEPGNMPPGPARMQVLTNPTAAQLRAIPLGSDVVITDREKFMSGVWVAEIRDSIVHQVEDHGWGFYMTYLPPVPTDLPEPQQIAEELTARFLPVVLQHADDETLTRHSLHAMAISAVTQARNGMLPAPW